MPAGFPIDTPTVLHASAVALNGRGLLILGPSGSGKSALSLTLLAYGADLVADDRVLVSGRDGLPWLSAPEGAAAGIEARQMGILNARAIAGAAAVLVADLSQVESRRLPPWRHVSVFGHDIACVHKIESGHFAPAILQYLRADRSA